MLRIVTLFVIATLLSGCTTVFVPIPVPINDGGIVLPAATAAATPAPAVSPIGTLEEFNAFKAKYDALDAPYKALSAHLDTMAFNDPEWRAETVRLAQEWRAAIDDLRNMQQPHGRQWEKAWPVLMQAMDEYAYAAGAVESAASMNDPSLLTPVRAKLINGVNLTGEAMRLLKGE